MTQAARGCRFLLSIVALLVFLTKVNGAERFQIAVFTSGEGGYHTCRIPAMVLSRKGTLLAFCEGRKKGGNDEGDIDLLLRRSTDIGRTWGPVQLVHEEGGDRPITIGNPCPVVDQETGTIWLTFCRNNNEVFVTSSDDDGGAWSKPKEITASVKRPEWGWYATGPGCGIQLHHENRRGRLVIPCDHRESVDGKQMMFSHVFFSDDHGASWELGGTVDRHTDECQVVELAGGGLLINMRNYWGTTGNRPEIGKRRAIARSSDGGESWSPLEFDETLIEPICQASLISLEAHAGAKPRLAFCNPASTDKRMNLTLRISSDEGKSWPVSEVIDAGPSAYSSMAQLGDGTIGILYEQGNYRELRFVLVSVR